MKVQQMENATKHGLLGHEGDFDMKSIEKMEELRLKRNLGLSLGGVDFGQLLTKKSTVD